MAGKLRATILKVTNKQVDGLKGKLLEIRKIGSRPIYITVGRRDNLGTALKNADIPTDSDTKLEGIKTGSKSWEPCLLRDNAYKFDKVAVTTKVAGL